MPKLKTKSGVRKHFKLTATGKIKHGAAGKRHRLISHNAKYIRRNRGAEAIRRIADESSVSSLFDQGRAQSTPSWRPIMVR